MQKGETMLDVIKDFLEFRRRKNQQRISCKRFMITQAMIRYFEDLQQAKGSVELPPYISAVNAVNTLNTDRKINRMYRKMEMAGLV